MDLLLMINQQSYRCPGAPSLNWISLIAKTHVHNYQFRQWSVSCCRYNPSCLLVPAMESIGSATLLGYDHLNFNRLFPQPIM